MLGSEVDLIWSFKFMRANHSRVSNPCLGIGTFCQAGVPKLLSLWVSYLDKRVMFNGSCVTLCGAKWQLIGDSCYHRQTNLGCSSSLVSSSQTQSTLKWKLIFSLQHFSLPSVTFFILSTHIFFFTALRQINVFSNPDKIHNISILPLFLKPNKS